MRHDYVQTIDLLDVGEIGLCTCGWQSEGRVREDGGYEAVRQHRRRAYELWAPIEQRTKGKLNRYKVIAS